MVLCCQMVLEIHQKNTTIIQNIREIAALQIPIFGICLGHQLMALANGCRTEKLKYGHRGANQPVIDLKSGRTYVTSQNHGYAVVGESIQPEIGEVSHINANDHTCEGIRYKTINAFTVQFTQKHMVVHWTLLIYLTNLLLEWKRRRTDMPLRNDIKKCL